MSGNAFDRETRRGLSSGTRRVACDREPARSLASGGIAFCNKQMLFDRFVIYCKCNRRKNRPIECGMTWLRSEGMSEATATPHCSAGITVPTRVSTSLISNTSLGAFHFNGERISFAQGAWGEATARDQARWPISQ